MTFTIRRATQEDKEAWVRMRKCLWPEAPLDYLTYDLDEVLSDPRQAAFVASYADGSLVAFIEVSLRDYAEGCETSPVGYIEAWFVGELVRGQKLGRDLVHTAEQWARERGCTEMASDTWLEEQQVRGAEARAALRNRIREDKALAFLSSSTNYR